MGLIILILTGALLGWLATILLMIEQGTLIWRNVLAGLIGSVVTGLVMSGGLFLGTIMPLTLLYAAIGAIVLVAIYNAVRRKALP